MDVLEALQAPAAQLLNTADEITVALVRMGRRIGLEQLGVDAELPEDFGADVEVSRAIKATACHHELHDICAPLHAAATIATAVAASMRGQTTAALSALDTVAEQLDDDRREALWSTLSWWDLCVRYPDDLAEAQRVVTHLQELTEELLTGHSQQLEEADMLTAELAAILDPDG